MNTTDDWDERWLDLARHVGGWSKDRSRQVGCVIVGEANVLLSIGYNGFPRGVDDEVPERHERPVKYDWTEHAERNAIFNAARIGAARLGTTMYGPWYPCAACARAIVHSGITTLVAIRPEEADPVWDAEFVVSERTLREGGVLVRLSS